MHRARTRARFGNKTAARLRKSKTTAKAASMFLVDAMLGSLARKLRVYGFDAEYFNRGSDNSILGRAKRSNRVILTADAALSDMARKRGAKCLFIRGGTDLERMRSLGLEAHRSMIRLRAGDSRCALCNRVLTPVIAKEGLGRRVPETILNRHRLFYECRSCEKVYWRGSHWDRLRRVLKELDNKKKHLIRERSDASNVAHRRPGTGSRGPGKANSGPIRQGKGT